MPTCTQCDSHVTASFQRVFGDRDGRVRACPNCAPQGHLGTNDPPAPVSRPSSSAVPNDHESLADDDTPADASGESEEDDPDPPHP